MVELERRAENDTEWGLAPNPAILSRIPGTRPLSAPLLLEVRQYTSRTEGFQGVGRILCVFCGGKFSQFKGSVVGNWVPSGVSQEVEEGGKGGRGMGQREEGQRAKAF